MHFFAYFVVLGLRDPPLCEVIAAWFLVLPLFLSPIQYSLVLKICDSFILLRIKINVDITVLKNFWLDLFSEKTIGFNFPNIFMFIKIFN